MTAAPMAKWSFAVIACAPLLCVDPACAASFHYTRLDVAGQRLTNLGGGASLNDNDQVVGTTLSSANVYQGFLWQNGAFTLFQQCDILNSIDAGGLAVGYDSSNFGVYCTVATGTGVTTTYPIKTRGNVRLTGVNASGTVVAQTTRQDDKTQGLILTRKHTTKFAVPGSQAKYGGTFPTGINDSGTIVGSYTPPASSWNQGFTDTAGNYALFNVPGALGTYPLFITEDGTVGGEYLVAGGTQTERGFVLSSSAYTTFNPPGAVNSYVSGIGPSGEIVGSWNDSAGASHGFIYTGGVYYRIDVPGARSTMVEHVNALGSLAGFYYDAQSNTHPFIAQCKVPGACTQ